jgi:hypothetical protein
MVELPVIIGAAVPNVLLIEVLGGLCGTGVVVSLTHLFKPESKCFPDLQCLLVLW